MAQNFQDDEQLSLTDNRRGLHRQHYHNQAKINLSEPPEFSYKKALKFVY